MIKSTYKNVFAALLRTLEFSNIYQSFDSYGEEYGLWKPHSKASFMIQWLLQIEPPFYFFLNQACRTMDATLLNMLGPFSQALSQVLFGAEVKRKDKLPSGNDIF